MYSIFMLAKYFFFIFYLHFWNKVIRAKNTMHRGKSKVFGRSKNGIKKSLLGTTLQINGSHLSPLFERLHYFMWIQTLFEFISQPLQAPMTGFFSKILHLQSCAISHFLVALNKAIMMTKYSGLYILFILYILLNTLLEVNCSSWVFF